MPELPDCNVCGKQLELILNKLTWGYPNDDFDKVELFCSCGEGGGQALIKDLTPRQQQFFESLQEHMHKNTIFSRHHYDRIFAAIQAVSDHDLISIIYKDGTLYLKSSTALMETGEFSSFSMTRHLMNGFEKWLEHNNIGNFSGWTNGLKEKEK